MSKYIDLAPAIEGFFDPVEVRAGIRVGLSWLDDHPDQVPGRTITQSDYQKIIDETSVSYGVGFTDGFHQAGGSIIPDPEPTNAEKWVKFCSSKMGLDLDPWQANVLDKAGVKAPGSES